MGHIVLGWDNLYYIDLAECTPKRPAECLCWARCSAFIALPIVLNGPRETPVSCMWNHRIGPALHLRSAADHMVWATLSFNKTMSITLFWPNSLLRELPNTSSGPSATPLTCCQFYRMGQGRHWYWAHDTQEWAKHFTWEVPLIVWHRPHYILKKYCLSHSFTWMLPWASSRTYHLGQVQCIECAADCFERAQEDTGITHTMRQNMSSISPERFHRLYGMSRMILWSNTVCLIDFPPMLPSESCRMPQLGQV